MIGTRKYVFILSVGCGILTGGCSTGRNFGPPDALRRYRSIAVIGEDSSGRLRRHAGAIIAIEDLIQGHLIEKGYGVVERSILDKAFAELELERSGLMTDSASSRIGKWIKSDAIMLVQVTDAQVVRSRTSGLFQDLANRAAGAAGISPVDAGPTYESRVRLSVRLVDVETAEVKCVLSATANVLVISPMDIAPAYEHAVDRVAARFPNAATTPVVP